jgi:membrane protein YqaA with SNARE-associated domain
MGARFILRHLFTVPSYGQLQAEAHFHRWGTAALFFSWLRIVGDPIAFLAGVLRAPLGQVTFWVILGRGLRFAVVIWSPSAALQG